MSSSKAPSSRKRSRAKKQPVRDAIVYRARRVNAVVQREVDRLGRELPEFKIFIVCYEPEYDSALHSVPGTAYYYGQRDLHALPYPQKLSAVNWSDPKTRPPVESDSKKFFRAMEWGHQDLPVLKFFLDHSDFDRYWIIEDDVRCSGPWSEIFTELARSSADLLMTAVQDYTEAPGWFWWQYLNTGNEVLPLDRRVKGFPPFCRLSKACLQAIDQKYRHGWGGHYEVVWTTIARASGLSIEDVGSQGSYTPIERRDRFYTYNCKSGSLFPGTFIYRPAFLDTGVSEFGKNVLAEVMLWHPVKMDVRPAFDSPDRTGPLLNLAFRKPALQSSVSSLFSLAKTAAEDAKGGNNGHLSDDYGFHTRAEQDPWWQVDLEDLFLIHRAVIFNRSSQADRLKHFSLLGSQDGSEWKVLFRKTDDHVFGRGGEPYTIELADRPLARFVRVRLDGQAPLHFRECQVFGIHPDAKLSPGTGRHNDIPAGRRGRVVQVGSFVVFVDYDNYDRRVVEALERGDYEEFERQLVSQLVTQRDRVIDVGTAIGSVAMTAASVVGAESVVTFDGNPDIVNDARANFKRNRLEGIRSHVGILRNRQTITDPHEMKTFYIDKAFWASRLHASAADSNIVKTVQVPIVCLEDVIENHRATVLICDMEGAEVELLRGADLSRIRLIIMETHYWVVGEVATDEMVRDLIQHGFSLDLGLSGFFGGRSRRRVLVLRRPGSN